MNKFGIALFALSLATGSLAATATPAWAAGNPVLRAAATVDGDTVRLGDLFDNAGERADAIIANAPPPGHKTIFEAPWLSSIARANRLNWTPSGRYDRAVVERSSQVVNHIQIEQELLYALSPQIKGDKSQIELTNGNVQIYIPASAVPTIGVENLVYNDRTQQFVATVAVPADTPTAARIRVSGRVVSIAQVPVLNRRVETGEVVQSRDIDWTEMRADRVRNDIVADADRLIGRAARRTLRENEPIRTSDIRMPILVEKNAIVTMIVRTASLTLTAQGRANDSGSVGETVRVTNTISHTVIEGTVSGQNTVSVMPSSATVVN